jgi:hypothetical protein
MDTAIRNLLPAILLLLGCQTATASTWTFASGGNSYSTSGSSYGNQITYSQGWKHWIAQANTAVAIERSRQPTSSVSHLTQSAAARKQHF